MSDKIQIFSVVLKQNQILSFYANHYEVDDGVLSFYVDDNPIASFNHNLWETCYLLNKDSLKPVVLENPFTKEVDTSESLDDNHQDFDKKEVEKAQEIEQKPETITSITSTNPVESIEPLNLMDNQSEPVSLTSVDATVTDVEDTEVKENIIEVPHSNLTLVESSTDAVSDEPEEAYHQQDTDVTEIIEEDTSVQNSEEEVNPSTEDNSPKSEVDLDEDFIDIDDYFSGLDDDFKNGVQAEYNSKEQPKDESQANTKQDLENDINVSEKLEVTEQEPPAEENPFAELDELESSNDNSAPNITQEAEQETEVTEQEPPAEEDPFAALDELEASDDSTTELTQEVEQEIEVTEQEPPAEEDPFSTLDELEASDNSIHELTQKVEQETEVTEQEPPAEEDPFAALDELEQSGDVEEEQAQLPAEDPFSVLDNMVAEEKSNEKSEIKTKEFSLDENSSEDSLIKEDGLSSELDSIEELLAQLPDNENSIYAAQFENGNREIRRVNSNLSSDFDDMDSLIGKQDKQEVQEPKKGIFSKVTETVEKIVKMDKKPAKEEPKEEFMPEPEPQPVQKLAENPMIRNSQGRLLTPQELKIKKEKIIEKTITQYCSKFDKFNHVKLCELLSKNTMAQPYAITESDIIWVATKMIRNYDIDADKFSSADIQTRLNYFLPGLMKLHWDGSIGNMYAVINDIPQLKDVILIDLGVWLLNNNY